MTKGRSQLGRPFSFALTAGAVGRSASLAAAVLLAPLGSSAWSTEEVATVEELVERGFQIVAQGQLLEANHETCLALRINGEAGSRCGVAGATYGVFRRLTKDAEAFVCVSFRNWTCFRSETGQVALQPSGPAAP